VITVIPEVYAQPYDIDWQDEGTQVGKVQDFQLSASGGSENLKYMISGGYFSQDGIIINENGYKRFSFRGNVELKINDWIKTGLLLAPTLENLDLVNSMESYFSGLITSLPIVAPYDENGDPAWVGNFAGVPGPWQWRNGTWAVALIHW